MSKEKLKCLYIVNGKSVFSEEGLRQESDAFYDKQKEIIAKIPEGEEPSAEVSRSVVRESQELRRRATDTIRGRYEDFTPGEHEEAKDALWKQYNKIGDTADRSKKAGKEEKSEQQRKEARYLQLLAMAHSDLADEKHRS